MTGVLKHKKLAADYNVYYDATAFVTAGADAYGTCCCSSCDAAAYVTAGAETHQTCCRSYCDAAVYIDQHIKRVVNRRWPPAHRSSRTCQLNKILSFGRSLS